MEKTSKGAGLPSTGRNGSEREEVCRLVIIISGLRLQRMMNGYVKEDHSVN
jgi:hypothetical protein